MSFTIFTDTSANLDGRTVADNDIRVLPFTYEMNGEIHTCLDNDSFDDTAYYNAIRRGAVVTTSMIPMQTYLDAWRPVLEEGRDILFVSMSSGISGSYHASVLAAAELRDAFPDRVIETVDSLGASLGEGLVVLHAIRCREQGMDVGETAAYLNGLKHRILQVFFVDDLMHLKRTGRLSNIAAVMGIVLGIRPLLKGDEKGRIVASAKVRGRRQIIQRVVQTYRQTVVAPERQTVCISHCGCAEDAELLRSLVQEAAPPAGFRIVKHEPVTGSHLGPGSLALYYLGSDGDRQRI